MKKGLKLLGLIAGVVAIASLAVGGAVLADTPEETAAPAECAGYGWHGFGGEGATCSETVADLLGLTADDLCDLRQEGKSLAEIAVENGVSVDDLVAAIMAEKIAAVEARVADGSITQEQADLMIERMTERTELAVNRTTTGPAEWRMGNGNGRSGEGAGTGSANRWGSQNETGRGSCYGDAGTGMAQGGMNKWGRGGR